MVNANLLNSYFSSLPEVKMLSPFEDKEKDGRTAFYGKFELQLNLETSFRVDTMVPRSYPLGELKFNPEGVSGYSHQGWDGQLCLNTPLVIDSSHFEAKPELSLQHEVDRLKKWLQDYVIDNKQDSEYEYPAKEESPDMQILFSEGENSDVHTRFTHERYGNFKYIVVRSLSMNGYTQNFGKRIVRKLTIPFILMAKDIGNMQAEWSDHYMDKEEEYTGFWVYVDTPPILWNKQQIVLWSELEKLLPKDCKKRIHNYLSNLGQLSPKTMPYAVCMVGYKIPRGEESEIHWDLILIPISEVNRLKKSNSLSLYPLRNQTIQWGRSINISYNRYFGRGKLCNDITNANILVIGCGAIGSNLVLSLVRGGVKNLSLLDADIVEPGNICRAEYTLLDVPDKKTKTLTNQARTISPFVNIHIHDELKDNLSYICKDDDYYETVVDLLNTYDYIFDCTANSRLTYLLDTLELKTQVINFSITDRAEDFVCITGTRRIQYTKDRIFRKEFEKEQITSTFKEGTGCWHPTFNASYVDIHSLTGMALKEINNRLSKGLTLQSFVIYCSMDNLNTSYSINYNI